MILSSVANLSDGLNQTVDNQLEDSKNTLKSSYSQPNTTNFGFTNPELINGSFSNPDAVYDILIDDNGEIYVAVVPRGTTFSAGGYTVSGATGTTYNCYIFKFDSSFQYKWHREVLEAYGPCTSIAEVDNEVRVVIEGVHSNSTYSMDTNDEALVVWSLNKTTGVISWGKVIDLIRSSSSYTPYVSQDTGERPRLFITETNLTYILTVLSCGSGSNPCRTPNGYDNDYAEYRDDTLISIVIKNNRDVRYVQIGSYYGDDKSTDAQLVPNSNDLVVAGYWTRGSISFTKGSTISIAENSVVPSMVNTAISYLHMINGTGTNPYNYSKFPSISNSKSNYCQLWQMNERWSIEITNIEVISHQSILVATKGKIIAVDGRPVPMPTLPWFGKIVQTR